MRKELFNKNWLYWKETNAFALVWNTDPAARIISLPHDAMIEEKTKVDSINAGNSGYRDGGVYYYSKEFTPTEEMRNQVLMLHFEGVYMNAFVYVNAQLAKKWNYGYTGFYVNLNDYLEFGKKNEIRVIVRNSGMPNSRWYSGGGIYRDVYLLTAPTVYIRPDANRIATESIDDGIGVISVGNTVVSRKVGGCNLLLKRSVKDADGVIVAEETIPVLIYEGEEREVQTRFAIQNAKLWSDETPYLYTLETTIYEVNENGEQVLDSDRTTFGVRTLTLDSIRGLRVNGKTVKLRGACIHHDNGLVGAATYYDFHYRQIKGLKESGFNAIRMAHHPAAPVLLKACDELGMYVMDECFDMWTRCKTANDYALFFEQCWEQDVEAMVRNDFCHPSVILYSIGNEIPEIGTSRGVQIATQIADKIRSMDTTRFTLSSINGIFAIGTDIPEVLGDVMSEEEKRTMVLPNGNVNEFMATMAHGDDVVNHPIVSRKLAAAGAATDIVGYNYMTARYESDATENPNRVIVGSETYCTAIAENWRLVKKLPSLIGDFVWTGWDYLGESGIGIAAYEMVGDGFGTPYPCLMAYSGDIDITGYRKPASYLADIAFGTRVNPYICVQDPAHYNDQVFKTPWSLTDKLENWTYPGMDGAPIHVDVYSAGDEVELLLNGKSVGIKPAGEAVNYVAEFDVTYEPGALEAVSYKFENEVRNEIGRFALQTAGETSLVISVEPGASGKIAYINVESRDAAGTLKYEQGTEIIAKLISGDARIYIGTGNHSPIEGYTEGVAKLYNGRAQVVVVKEVPGTPVVIEVDGRDVSL